MEDIVYLVEFMDDEDSVVETIGIYTTMDNADKKVEDWIGSQGFKIRDRAETEPQFPNGYDTITYSLMDTKEVIRITPMELDV